MSYKNLKIWQLSQEVVIDIHAMTLELPAFEEYEEGAQIRRSSKSIKSCITEGYGRRKYKAEFLKFMIYAQASNDETIDHLENLIQTGSIRDPEAFEPLMDKLIHLGRMINNFIKGVEKSDWRRS